MKRFSILLLLAVAITSHCGAQAIKLTTYNARFVKNADGNQSHVMGVPAATIAQQEFAGAVVYWKLEVLNFKAIKAKYRLEIKVMQVKNGQESIAYKNEMYLPAKNGWQYLFSEFMEGDYVIYVRDADHPEDVYSKVNFTVPGKPKVDYKHNSTLVVCKSVDDSWNAVAPTLTVKAGECMNFLYKAKDRVGYSTMVWNVTKVNAAGNEDYVTDLIQGTEGKPFRWLATTEGVCAFTTPGKYRVYLFHKDDYDTSIRRGEESNYIGKTEITVY